MNGTMKAVVLAVLSVSVAFCMLACESDASPTTVYGSPDVGAVSVSFDAAGGNGGYTQYVMNGNTIYLPTEYKAPGDSNASYTRIARDGYVLSGWKSGDTVYWPGQPYAVTGSVTFTAQWTDLTYDCIEKMSGNSQNQYTEAQNAIVATGQNPNLTLDRYGSYTYMWVSERSEYKYILTVTCNGDTRSSETTSRNTSISAHWLTLSISREGKFTFSGTPSAPGTTVISVQMQTKNWSYGDLDDFVCIWYVSTYDGNDPSNICHVTYGSYDAYGPYNTAVRLPDRDTSVGYQNGWNISVDGSPAVFPVGGSYSVKQKETVLTASTYNADSVIASGVVGVIAYNANGGTYNGSFAEIVPSEGYAGLKNGSIVTKSGYTFIGWNSSGSVGDPIYPVGYLYDLEGDYTELKAVWGTPSGSGVSIHCNNPGDGAQNVSYSVYPGYTYALPVNGFDLTGYVFLGWSSVRYDPGEGSVNVAPSVKVGSDTTYYAVFEAETYTYRITYVANNGSGASTTVEGSSKTVPFGVDTIACPWTYDGHEFAGWAETRYADSPSFAEGGVYTFTGSGEATLYAVWTEKSVPAENLFVIVFNGNGTGVTNVPSQMYRTITATSSAFQIPSHVPQKKGYDFLGWSKDPESVSAQYLPGAVVTLDLQEGETRCVWTLYAVWSERSTGGDGTKVVITFIVDSGTYAQRSVATGSILTEIVAPAKEGYAFLGWYNKDTAWDFRDPVTGDMTLNAKYLHVFDLEISGTSVTVKIGCVCSSITISFSDGFAGTYASPSIPAHDVAENSSGKVTVSVKTEQGDFVSYRSYAVGSSALDPGGNVEVDGTENGDSLEKIAAIVGLLVILAAFAIARRFL